MQDSRFNNFTEAWEARVHGDFIRAELLAQSILTCAEENHRPILAIKAYKLLGNLAMDQDNLSQARMYYEKALAKHSRVIENKLSKAHTMRHLGSIYTFLEEWTLAENQLRQSIEMYEEAYAQRADEVSELDMANAYRPMAILMSQRARKDEAIEWWEKATEFYIKAGIATGQDEGEEAIQELKAS